MSHLALSSNMPLIHSVSLMPPQLQETNSVYVSVCFALPVSAHWIPPLQYLNPTPLPAPFHVSPDYIPHEPSEQPDDVLTSTPSTTSTSTGRARTTRSSSCLLPNQPLQQPSNLTQTRNLSQSQSRMRKSNPNMNGNNNLTSVPALLQQQIRVQHQAQHGPPSRSPIISLHPNKPNDLQCARLTPTLLARPISPSLAMVA